ncbi:hypothetical protein BDN72DRAFT_846052 [Pluteus cervinus]|uniref:Uncharacterized protein n=1 Tax=Pluteus cervinus TaxID=181527 RepID=A0ACD3AJM0_9AGAR|nr:hypothetical protein BDN72DRAFT_846052 [Pluteus cervinus]
MADSLSSECTPLKKEYDLCFNAWFAGYLEPAVRISASSSSNSSSSSSSNQSSNNNPANSSPGTPISSWPASTSITAPAGGKDQRRLTAAEIKAQKDAQAAREKYSKEKAEEFQRKCGGIWKDYRSCVQKAVKDKGLDALLQQAREENPLVNPPPPMSTPASKPEPEKAKQSN